MYLLALSAEKSYKQRYTVATNPLSTQILISKYHSTTKESNFFGEMTDSRAETRKFKISLEHFLVPESMEVLKKTKEQRHIKGIQGIREPNGIHNAKAGTVQATKEINALDSYPKYKTIYMNPY